MHPQPETYWGNVNPIGVRSVYDESKRFAEAATMAYHRDRGADVAIVRIFNTYGPRMALDDGRAIPTFITQALRGEPMTVHGTGEQTRSICYVDDLVRGILLLLDSTETGPINCGTEHEITMRELAEMIVALTGSSSTVVHLPQGAGRPGTRRPDLTLARTLLGYEPSVPPAETGCAARSTYFATRLGIAGSRLDGISTTTQARHAFGPGHSSCVPPYAWVHGERSAASRRVCPWRRTRPRPAVDRPGQSVPPTARRRDGRAPAGSATGRRGYRRVTPPAQPPAQPSAHASACAAALGPHRLWSRSRDRPRSPAAASLIGYLWVKGVDDDLKRTDPFSGVGGPAARSWPTARSTS